MNLLVNGKKEVVEGEKISIEELLKKNDVQNPEMVSVQLNGEFVDRADYAKVTLEENNEVDFLYFMGGGSK